MPVFSELLEKGDRVRAWRVASTIFFLTLLGLRGLTALFMLAAPAMISLFGDARRRARISRSASRASSSRWSSCSGSRGVVVGILNTYDHFTVPALTPVAWNLVIIAGPDVGGAVGGQRGRASSTSTRARS